MKAESQKLLAQLESQLTAQPNDASVQRAALYLKRAILAIGLGDWQRAAQSFQELALIAQIEERSLPQAQALYAQGLAQRMLVTSASVQPESCEETTQALRKAAQVFEELGQVGKAKKIRKELKKFQAEFSKRINDKIKTPEQAEEFFTDTSNIDKFYDDLQQSNADLNDSITTLLDNPLFVNVKPEIRIELYCFRALWHQSNQNFDLAESDWKDAFSVAQKSNRTDLLDYVQAKQNTSDTELSIIPKFDPLSLAEIGLRQGFLPLQDVALSKSLLALQEDDWEALLLQSNKARHQALKADTSDRYARYFFACLFTALAQEGLSDHAKALEILLMCKATLDNSWANGLGKHVSYFVEGLPERWGSEKFMAVKLEVRNNLSQRTNISGSKR